MKTLCSLFVLRNFFQSRSKIWAILFSLSPFYHFALLLLPLVKYCPPHSCFVSLDSKFYLFHELYRARLKGHSYGVHQLQFSAIVILFMPGILYFKNYLKYVREQTNINRQLLHYILQLLKVEKQSVLQIFIFFWCFFLSDTHTLFVFIFQTFGWIYRMSGGER